MRTHHEPRAAAGGAGLPQWLLLTSTDQGVAPHDPSGFTGAGTGFTAGTGTFKWVIPGGVSIYDGTRENLPRWTKRILDIYPTYDPNEDILELAWDYVTPPALSPTDEEMGCCFGILDRTTADLANNNGPNVGIYGVSPTAYTTCSVNTTAVGGTGGCLVPDLAVLKIFRGGFITASNREMMYDWWLRNTNGTHQVGARTDNPLAMALSPSAWVFNVAAIKRNPSATVGNTMEGRLYTRLHKTTGFSSLPA